jgi:hypothetical protein
MILYAYVERERESNLKRTSGDGLLFVIYTLSFVPWRGVANISLSASEEIGKLISGI